MKCIGGSVLGCILLCAFVHTLGFAGSPQGKDSAAVAACPAEEWIRNCVVIERGEIEINGVQWRYKGKKDAYRIAGNPSGLPPELFKRIQEALDFTGVDKCTRE